MRVGPRPGEHTRAPLRSRASRAGRPRPSAPSPPTAHAPPPAGPPAGRRSPAARSPVHRAHARFGAGWGMGARDERGSGFGSSSPPTTALACTDRPARRTAHGGSSTPPSPPSYVDATAAAALLLLRGTSLLPCRPCALAVSCACPLLLASAWRGRIEAELAGGDRVRTHRLCSFSIRAICIPPTVHVTAAQGSAACKIANRKKSQMARGRRPFRTGVRRSLLPLLGGPQRARCRGAG